MIRPHLFLWSDFEFAFSESEGSVPKDGREGLVNGDYVRKFVRIDPYESSNLIIRFSSLF